MKSSNLFNLHFKGNELFNYSNFEASRFWNLEVQMNGIQNIVVFKRKSKCSAYLQAPSSCDDLSRRTELFQVKSLWTEDIKFHKLE